MGVPNLKYFRKAYMLEFLKGEEVEECFTFSIPPEGEDFDFGQRLTETKTFGGSVFDRYGNDTIKINLSGTTGNEERKLIYRGFDMPLYLNGEKEIWELQRIIQEFHDISNATDGQTRTIFLYDLSKMNIMQLAAVSSGKVPNVRNWWQVFIKDFKIKRSSSKPNYYNYTLEMYGVVDSPSKHSTLMGGIAEAADKFTSAMETLETCLAVTSGFFAAIQTTTNAIAKVKKAADAYDKLSGQGKVFAVLKGLDSTNSRLLGSANNDLYNSAKDVLAMAGQLEGIASADYNDDVKKAEMQSTNYYAVIFNTNGGSNISTQKVEYSKTATKPTDPTKDKYTFAGWYSDAELTTEYDFKKEITADITLYAKWVQSVATITFNSKNGSRVASQDVAIGGKITIPDAPTRSGYIFKEWCTDYAAKAAYDFETAVTGDMTLYAAWTTVAVVTFNANGGSEIEEQIVSINGKAVYPKTPTRENYTFSCWCSDSELATVFDFNSNITENITLYAKWVQISNTVTFRSNGGTSVASQDVMIGSYATEPESPTKEGFNFVYWCDDVDCTNEFHFNTTPVTGPLTLYAKWAAKEITVTFDSAGGSAIESQVIGYGDMAVFPEIPTKENAVFVMWQKRIENEVEVDSGEVDENDNPIMTTEIQYSYEEYDFATELKDDLTLYAKWFGA